ncbi:MAG: glycerophosphodiester phosphodiesterase [Lachnospiraceae bacterium]|jgi:glycerophosphoryl diester phosphodiesterase|nr:glycerophosphodiester phosphodiesterase [Lachnospiraceae bacterium]
MSDIKVWAHRGASGYAPENTLASFQKAADLGADGVELDVQLTKDGEIVVIHDETVDRTTDGSGWVKDFTFEELRKLNASYQNLLQGGEVVKKAKKFEEYESIQIPTMKEVFDLLKPTGLTINIELKTGIVFYPGLEEKILKLTEECGMEDRVIYSSFNHYTIEKIHSLKPEAEVGFLYSDGTIDMPAYGKTHGVNALHPALYNLQFPGYMEACRKAGLAVNVWTVNKPEYVAMCVKAGVDAVITNYPDMAMEVIRKAE